MRRLLVPLLSLLFMISTAAVAGGPADALFQKGNDHYRDGDYKKAVEAYETAITSGGEDPAVFYNLGNAYLRQGELGHAIASYLRARKLAPRDPDIKFNLNFAREKIQARSREIEQGPFSRAFNAVSGKLSANEWTLLLVACYWLSCAFAALWTVSLRDVPKKAGRAAFIVFVALFVVFVPLGVARIKQDVYTPRGVIVADKVKGLSGPGDDNTEIIDLYEGMDVKLGECREGWCRVRAAGGFVVWIPGSSLVRI